MAGLPLECTVPQSGAADAAASASSVMVKHLWRHSFLPATVHFLYIFWEKKDVLYFISELYSKKKRFLEKFYYRKKPLYKVGWIQTFMLLMPNFDHLNVTAELESHQTSFGF